MSNNEQELERNPIFWIFMVLFGVMVIIHYLIELLGQGLYTACPLFADTFGFKDPLEE